VVLRLSVEKDSPLVEPLRLRVPEWEARSNAKVSIEESDAVDPTADVAATSGVGLAKLPDRRVLSEPTLQSLDLMFVHFPYAYRSAFAARDRRPIALPLAADRLLLWYRTDLFGDKSLQEAYEKQHRRPLAPPKTWSEYAEIARFLQSQKAVKYGCVEACDKSVAGVRSLFARASSHFKEPRAFLLDSETGAPKLDGREFARALDEWKEALASSPAGAGSVDAAAARRVFAAGEAGMTLSTTPPLADPHLKKAPGMADKVGVAELPRGAAFDEKASRWMEISDRKSAPYIATTGYYLSISSKTQNPEAAEQLLLFLSNVKESSYLVQGARTGLTPLRMELLNESGRFSSYGLSMRTTTKFFDLVRDGIGADDWVTDLRIASSDEFLAALYGPLQDAIAGKKSTADALVAANDAWKKLAEAGGRALLDEYRQSLGYTPLPR
jgi:multiple sugar transport system substrate-binding protein